MKTGQENEVGAPTLSSQGTACSSSGSSPVPGLAADALRPTGTWTPGPWVERSAEPWCVENGECGTAAYVGIGPRDAWGPHVAIVVTTEWHDDPEFNANARLIAAAPALYEALRSAVVAMETLGHPEGFGALKKARAALQSVKEG